MNIFGLKIINIEIINIFVIEITNIEKSKMKNVNNFNVNEFQPGNFHRPESRFTKIDVARRILNIFQKSGSWWKLWSRTIHFRPENGSRSDPDHLPARLVPQEPRVSICTTIFFLKKHKPISRKVLLYEKKMYIFTLDFNGNGQYDLKKN